MHLSVHVDISICQYVEYIDPYVHTCMCMCMYFTLSWPMDLAREYYLSRVSLTFHGMLARVL